MSNSSSKSTKYTNKSGPNPETTSNWWVEVNFGKAKT